MAQAALMRELSGIASWQRIVTPGEAPHRMTEARAGDASDEAAASGTCATRDRCRDASWWQKQSASLRDSDFPTE
jgi:hypothetical protein